MIAYVRRFIPHCGELTAPLSAITSDKRPFVWTPERDRCFQELKKRLCAAPILQYPRRDCPYQLETDASDRAIGGVLRVLTKSDDFLPVAYESRVLQPTEQRYAIHDKELVAIVHCVKKWRCYLEGVEKIQVLTDHKSLIYFQTQAHLSRIQARWMEFLGNYNLIIQYRPGKDMLTADALSRLFVRSSTGDDGLDPDWPMIYNHNLDQELPANTSPKTRDMVIQNRHLFVNKNGVILRRLDDGNLAPYVPVSQRFDTIRRYHRELGHTKARNLTEFLRLKVWWPSLAHDVQEVLKQCATCEKFAKTAAPPKSVIPVQSPAPFEQWALNIIGPLPKAYNGKLYIITAIDYATRWPVAWATSNHQATTVARFIGSEIVAKFGAPKRLITDGGTKLNANAMKTYYAKHGLEHIVTTPYHPQSNGRIERLNGSLVEALSKLSADTPLDWPKHLPAALLTTRARTNRGTGYSPFELVYGSKPQTEHNKSGTLKLIKPTHIPATTAALQDVRQQADIADRKQMEKEFIPLINGHQVGDKVWVLNPDKSKLQPEKKGPYVVVVVHNNNTYTLRNPKGKLKRFHHDRLCPCHAFEEQRRQDPSAADATPSAHRVLGANPRDVAFPLTGPQGSRP